MHTVQVRKPKTKLTPRQLPNSIQPRRLAKGLTLQACADFVGVTAQAIHKAEVRGTGLDRHNWYKLAKCLGCSAEELEAPFSSA